MGMRIAMGSDHAGYTLKAFLKPIIEEWGHEVTDLGAYEGETGTDYPDYGRAVGQAVARGEYDCGILICGTGLGVSISANKVPGIRAALCHETYTARMARSHNDANVLCMGGRVLGAGVAADVVGVFLATPFSGVDRHQRRVEKIHAIERDAQLKGH
jgi:ribose 5-phosphate isomerase B